jgi:autotransporter translocation and assembly factor TamB
VKLLGLLRALKPLGRVVVAALAAGALVLIGHGLGLRWDPLDLAGRRLRAAQVQAAAATADAAARRLEVEGAADQARRIDHHHQQTAATERATARAAADARNAHDASTPLDPARAARLAGHDRELCRLAPAVCAAAAPEPADGGDDALRAGGPA